MKRVTLRPRCERLGTLEKVEGSTSFVVWDDGLGPYRCASSALLPAGSPADPEQDYTVAMPKRSPKPLPKRRPR